MARELILGLTVMLLGVVAWLAAHRVARRAGRRTLLRMRARVDRYKFTRKRYVIEHVLADAQVAAAVARHAGEQGEPEDDVWRRVRRYLDEIVPFFNVLAYYRLGYWVSRAALSLFRLSQRGEA